MLTGQYAHTPPVSLKNVVTLHKQGEEEKDKFAAGSETCRGPQVPYSGEVLLGQMSQVAPVELRNGQYPGGQGIKEQSLNGKESFRVKPVRQGQLR